MPLEVLSEKSKINLETNPNSDIFAEVQTAAGEKVILGESVVQPSAMPDTTAELTFPDKADVVKTQVESVETPVAETFLTDPHCVPEVPSDQVQIETSGEQTPSDLFSNTKAQGIDSLAVAVGNMAQDSRSKGYIGKDTAKYQDELNNIIGLNQSEEKVTASPKLKTQAAFDEAVLVQKPDSGSLVEIAIKVRKYLDGLDEYCRRIILKSVSAKQNDAQDEINRTRELIDDLVYTTSEQGRRNSSSNDEREDQQVNSTTESLTASEINSLLGADHEDTKDGNSDDVYVDGRKIDFNLTPQKEPETGDQALEKARNMALEQERLIAQSGRNRPNAEQDSSSQASQEENGTYLNTEDNPVINPLTSVNDNGTDPVVDSVETETEVLNQTTAEADNSSVTPVISPVYIDDLPPLPDESELSPDDENELTLPDSQLIPADYYDKTGSQDDFPSESDVKEGIIKDGNPQSVPRTQRAVLQSLNTPLLGRRQEPDDYIGRVASFDPWYQDILKAGYTEGPIHSALTFSVRRIDPQNKYHWIIVMSDHFSLFIQDPQFVHNITTKFSFMYGHALEINLQVYKNKTGGPHYPDESPYGLACREFIKAVDAARSSFFADKALAKFMEDQGQTPDSVNVTLYAKS